MIDGGGWRFTRFGDLASAWALAVAVPLAFQGDAVAERHGRCGGLILFLRGMHFARGILLVGVEFLPSSDAGGDRLLCGGLLAFGALRRRLDGVGGL